MSEPIIGEIQAFGFDFGQYGINNGTWLPCDGRSLAVPNYTPLFSLIGTYYGGNGSTTFNLPNFNGRIALSQGAGPGLTPRSVGEMFGTRQESLQLSQIPSHSHGLQLGNATAPNATAGPGSSGTTALLNPNLSGFVDTAPDTNFASNTIANKGNGAPHANTQPTLAMYYCICVAGIFPAFN